MNSVARDFLVHGLEVGAFKFGDYTLKSGPPSPYFFDMGSFHSGKSLAILSSAYASLVNRSQVDVVFGPAYKGISPAAVIAAHLFNLFQKDVGSAFNRKEAKPHGEGGSLIGACLQDKKVVIVDDVMTAGGTAEESVALVEKNGGVVVAYLIALDR